MLSPDPAGLSTPSYRLAVWTLRPSGWKTGPHTFLSTAARRGDADGVLGGDPADDEGDAGGWCCGGEPGSDRDGGTSADGAGTGRGVLGAELGLVLGGADDDRVAAAASRARR